MKLAVYTAAVPRREKNQFKRDLLLNFAHDARTAGDEVTVVDDYSVTNCDIAVLQGWIGMKTAPHLELRRSVIKHQRRSGGHTLVIDSNLLGFLAPQDFNRYLRYSLDGIFPTTGYYFDQNPDLERWRSIAQDYSFQEHAWNNTGRYILVCLQRDGGWSMDGRSVVDWLDSTLAKIKQHSDRPVMVRGHPGSTKTLPLIRERFAGIALSDLPDIRQDLDRAWCTVTYNSSPGVASVLWGVPAIVTDPEPGRSQASPWAAADISMVQRPQMPDRQDLYTRLAQCHFRTDRLGNGEAWRFMRARLP